MEKFKKYQDDDAELHIFDVQKADFNLLEKIRSNGSRVFSTF